MKGYMYILQCSDYSFYVGSTKYLEKRIAEHQNGEGANYTGKRLPVTIVYYEEFQRIDYAFYREQQVKDWTRKKKEALMKGEIDELHDFDICRNWSHYENRGFDSAQPPSNTVSKRT